MDRQLPFRGQAADDVRRLGRMQMAEDQRNGLGVFVDDERQKVLAVDLLQESEREGFDRLAYVFQRRPGRLAQGLLDQGLGNIQPARLARQGGRIRVGKLLNGGLLFLARDRPHFGNLDGNHLHLFGVQLAKQLSGLLLGHAHQQDRRSFGFQELPSC